MIDVASLAEMIGYLETHFPRVSTGEHIKIPISLPILRRGSVVHDRALVEAL